MTGFDVSSERPIAGLEQFEAEFLADRRTECQYLRTFHDNGDYDAIAKMAHKWKGIASPYGFKALEQLSKDLESSCQESNLSTCLKTIELIEGYLLDKKKFIEG